MNNKRSNFKHISLMYMLKGDISLSTQTRYLKLLIDITNYYFRGSFSTYLKPSPSYFSMSMIIGYLNTV